jgi:NAD(P)-dependent dehydrogenase (short-subunit alcohol dehydrogenase family)
LSAYSISKTAIIKLSENLAVETRKHRIKIFSVNPGLLRHGMTEALLAAEVPPESPVGIMAEWFRRELESGQEVPLEKGAELVALLATGRADALTGRYLSVYDDVEALVGRAASIKSGDLQTLRLAT